MVGFSLLETLKRSVDRCTMRKAKGGDFTIEEAASEGGTEERVVFL